MKTKDRFFPVFYLVLFCGVFIYILLRANQISFVHDESVSFKLIMGDLILEKTANDHLLNTAMMRVCSKIFGSSEWSLRLPNVLAFILYFYACYKIFNQRKSIPLSVLGLTLVIFNPYLLDFFSLARGYGLSLGFGMASIYFMFRNDESSTAKNHINNTFLCLVFSMLAAFSNYSALNLNLSLMVLLITELLILKRDKTVKFSNPDRILLFLIFACNIAGALFLTNKLLILDELGQLYAGGKNNFIDDTISVLIHRSLYFNYYGELAWKRILQLILFLYSLNLIIQISAKKYTLLSRITILLTLMISASVMQHYIFGTLYPSERTSLLFIPLFGLLVYFMVCETTLLFKPLYAGLISTCIMVGLALPLLYNFNKSINLKYTHEWIYDSNSKQVIQDIESDYIKHKTCGPRVRLQTSWGLEPALTYYKITRSMEYLDIFTEETSVTEADYLFLLPEGIKKLQTNDSLKIIHSFPKTNNMLVKRILCR